MGKTKLALEFAKKNDAFFYSDDRVLINCKTMEVVGGVNVIYKSKPIWKELFTDKKNIPQIKNKNIYKIKYLIYAFVEEGNLNNSYEFNIMDINKFEWHLYEELTRKIRALSKRVFKFTVPIPSLDTISLSINRVKHVNILVNNIDNIYCRSNSKNIINLIKSYSNKNP